MKSTEAVANLISNNDGYSVFRHVRSTPAYWKEQCKRVVAMVRQLGTSTVFLTLSAAETRWLELLVILKKVVDKENITEEQAANLSNAERTRLIRTDPVTCMRHFVRKYDAFLKHFLQAEDGIFKPNKAVDHYSRVEFQLRGSPHSHGLL